MSKDELIKFTNITYNYNDIEYLFSVIVCSAGPTLTKEKTSSLIVFKNSNIRNLQDIWHKCKEQIEEPLNISYFELKNDEKGTAVLFYNKEELECSIKNSRNMNFLKRFGYSEKMSLHQCLVLLSSRFENTCPHEIGIFLGYPVEDVALFIKCPNKKCKMVGYWKVYHNLEEAKKIFNKYDEIKYNIIRLMMNGIKPTDIDWRVGLPI